jgi:hypothetical protein
VVCRKGKNGVSIKATWDTSCLPVSVKSNSDAETVQVRFFTRHRWQLVTSSAPDKTI